MAVLVDTHRDFVSHPPNDTALQGYAFFISREIRFVLRTAERQSPLLCHGKSRVVIVVPCAQARLALSLAQVHTIRPSNRLHEFFLPASNLLLLESLDPCPHLRRYLRS
jgi:hypothetical protein